MSAPLRCCRYPNASSANHTIDVIARCGTGCLFNVATDPTEHNDIASANPARVASMTARLAQLRPSFYSNNETGVDVCPPGIGMPCACYEALPGQKWDGYFGPYQY